MNDTVCQYGPCETGISAGRFLCRPHWYKLPVELRDEITVAWRRRLVDPYDREKKERHERAKAQALEILEALDGN